MFDDQLHTDKTEHIITFPKNQRNLGTSDRPHLGMILFSVDKKTGIAESTKFKPTVVPHNVIPSLTNQANQIEIAHVQTKKEAVIDDTKWHVWAINKKNAERKFQKMLKELRKKMREKNG